MWRKTVNVVMLSLTGVCALIAVSVLFFILGYLVYHGGKDVNWDFFTKLPAPVGEAGGGMANAIVGSGKLLLLAALFGVPIGLLGGVYLAEFGGRVVPFVVRYTADLLNGVPSIVIGIFAYAVGGDAGASLLHPGRRICPGHHDDSHRAAQHRGISERRAALDARRRHGSGRQQMEDHLQRGASRRLARHSHGRSAGPGPRGRRNRAAAVHRFWQPLLEPRLGPADRLAAGDDLHLCRGSL